MDAERIAELKTTDRERVAFAGRNHLGQFARVSLWDRDRLARAGNDPAGSRTAGGPAPAPDVRGSARDG